MRKEITDLHRNLNLYGGNCFKYESIYRRMVLSYKSVEINLIELMS
ncbi:hypothetical protein BN1088_1430595 [Sphingobacterium sp. PM2-P1-29]|nr:hypothetical protein BN1088_1430595 [Sphingobacterium sp. PM2-P1-29]